MRTHLGKWEGMFLRYALTLHVAEVLSKGDILANNMEIPARIAENVATLFTRVFLQHTHSFYNEIVGTTETHAKLDNSLRLSALARKASVEETLALSHPSSQEML